MAGQALGLILAGANLGYQSLIVKPQRALGPYGGYVTLEEVHTDNMEITEHPIEQGALISDHAYLRQPELVIKAGWSNSQPDPGPFSGVLGDALNPLLGGVTGLLGTASKAMQSIGLGQSTNQVKDMYNKLLALQASRQPFDVFTGKRVYVRMLIKSLVTTSDKANENVLNITITLRSIMLVTTQLLTINAAPATYQKDPASTDGVMTAGAKALANAPKYNNPSGYLSTNP